MFRKKVLLLISIICTVLLAWALDTNLQQRHCINSNVIEELTLFSGEKNEEAIKIPSCLRDPFFHLPIENQSKIIKNMIQDMESLNSVLRSLPTTDRTIAVNVKEDFKPGILIQGSEITIDGDEIKKPHRLKKAILYSYLTHIKLLNNFGERQVMVDVLYSILLNKVNVGVHSFNTSEQLMSELLNTKYENYCESKLVAVNHMAFCHHVNDQNGKNNIKTIVDFKLSAERVLKIFNAYLKMSLKDKVNFVSLKSLKPEHWSLAYPSQQQEIVIYDEMQGENLSKLQYTKNSSGFTLTRGSMGEGLKSKYIVVLSCQVATLNKVLNYKNISDRLLYINNCDKESSINWNILFNEGVDSFVTKNKEMNFYLFHIPTVLTALKYKPKTKVWSELFSWRGVHSDSNSGVMRPIAYFDGILKFRLNTL